jgi:microcystin-dependent protein
MDVFIGSLMLVPYNYEPRGFAFCDGRILPIAPYAALYSLLGTQFGGDGKTTFALPDLRGRVPIGAGQGPGLSPYQQAAPGGDASVTLSIAQTASHNHTVNASTGRVDAESADGALPTRATPNVFSVPGVTPNTALAQGVVAAVGQGAPHSNLMPYTALNWVIALEGLYPTRP